MNFSAPEAKFGAPPSVKITRDESFCAVHITMTGGAADCAAIGSGFLKEIDGSLYLITNLHNLSGWDWKNNKSLSANGWLPDTVSIELCFVCEIKEQHSLYAFRTVPFDLFGDDDKPLWYVHPTLVEQVDVVALPLGTHANVVSLCTDAIDLATKAVNHLGWVNFSPAAGDDAMVLGYPAGMRGGSKFPIWKRASIAFEPNVDVDGLPKTMIDTATRRGMSGSLVIAVRRGISIPDGGSLNDGFIGESMTPLGVYSGRIGEDELGVQLGIVWKMSAVDEILAGLVQGTSPFVDRVSP
jgi:hypothetical protein